MRKIVIGPPVVEWVAARTGEFGNFGAAVGFGVEKDGELIAGTVFNDFNGAAICMHVASDGSKGWLSKEFLWMVFDYAFNQAKVRRIVVLIGEGNVEAQLFNEHIGFKYETELKDAHPTGNMLVYSMFRNTCRWLKHGKTPNAMRVSHELSKAA